MNEKELTQEILQQLIVSSHSLGDRISSLDIWLRQVLNGSLAPYSSSAYHGHLHKASQLLAQLKELQSTNQEQLHRLKQQ